MTSLVNKPTDWPPNYHKILAGVCLGVFARGCLPGGVHHLPFEQNHRQVQKHYLSTTTVADGKYSLSFSPSLSVNRALPFEVEVVAEALEFGLRDPLHRPIIGHEGQVVIHVPVLIIRTGIKIQEVWHQR